MKKIIILATLLFLFSTKPVTADTRVAGTSAEFKTSVAPRPDERAGVLEKYLAKHNSPLAPFAQDFVDAADANRLDWRLVPAITGVESTFGKRIPYKSYNAYGWANGEYRFTSWEESINVVSQTLREKYLDRGTPDINAIARRYAPPSKTWARNVRYFMKQIDPIPVNFDLEV